MNRKQKSKIGKHFFQLIEKNDYRYLRDLIVLFWNKFEIGRLELDAIAKVPQVSWDKKHYIFSLKNGMFLYVEVGLDVNFKTKMVEAVAICYKLYHQLFELSIHPVQYIAFSFLYQDTYPLDFINNYGMYHRNAALEIRKMEDMHYDEEQVESYKRKENLLGKNEFYIINMAMLYNTESLMGINDKFLVWLLRLHEDLMIFNQYIQEY